MIAIIAAISNDQEREAIEAIFEEHYPRMRSIAKGILGNDQDAEDAAMNAIAYMCAHADMFVDYTSKKTISLVYMCLRCAAINLYRRNQCRQKHTIFPDEETICFDQIPDEEPTMEDIVISEENCSLLAQAIEQLDDMYKIPILLRYNFHMRNTEIAEFLKIDVGKVNSRLFRGKKKVSKFLSERGYTYHE